MVKTIDYAVKCDFYMVFVVWFLREHVNLSFLWIFTYFGAREMLINYWLTKAETKSDTISMAPEV